MLPWQQIWHTHATALAHSVCSSCLLLLHFRKVGHDKSFYQYIMEPLARCSFALRLVMICAPGSNSIHCNIFLTFVVLYYNTDGSTLSSQTTLQLSTVTVYKKIIRDLYTKVIASKRPETKVCVVRDGSIGDQL